MLANENLVGESNVAGFIKVYNYGGFMAYFAIVYYLNGRLAIKRSPMFSLGQSQIIGIPAGATNVQFSAAIAVYWSSWKTVCRKNFSDIPVKCYSLTGTTWFAACNEMPCSTGGNGIPPIGNIPNCCCNCCCCNNTIC